MAHRILATALFTLSSLVLVACGATIEAAATLIVEVTIVDQDTEQPVIGTVFVDDRRVAKDISASQVAVPADTLPHVLRVEAPGCAAWSLGVRASTLRARTMKGAARLRCGADGRLRG